MLFTLCIHILSTRKRPFYKLHLGFMIALFVLSTIHIVLEYVLVFYHPFLLGFESSMLYDFVLRDITPCMIWIRKMGAFPELLTFKLIFGLSK